MRKQSLIGVLYASISVQLGCCILLLIVVGICIGLGAVLSKRPESSWVSAFVL